MTTDGADLLLRPRADSPVLGHVTAAELGEAILYRGKTYSMVESPSLLRLVAPADHPLC